MDVFLALLAGTAAGFLIAYLLRARAVKEAESQAGETREELARANAALATEKALAEQSQRASSEKEAWLEKQGKEVKATFEALAAKALESSNKSFLDRATERMKPLEEKLESLKKVTKEMETKRDQAYGSLTTELGSLRKNAEGFHREALKLTEALSGSSQARGRWGEMVLRNIAELAGMTEHCDFVEQEAATSSHRPDMVVTVPQEGSIPIDAKFPLAAYQRALDAETAGDREKLLKQHAKDLRTHIRTLKGRDYSSAVTGSVDFTVLFLPGDHLLSAAFEVEPNLQEEAFRDRILICTPVTLIALLRTVALYWKQQKLAENALGIQKCAEDLFDRVRVFSEHVGKVGKNLGSAVEGYNKAVGSFDSRILPAGRKLQELQGKQDSLPGLKEISEPVRKIESSLE
jgi:DNA recombination protein RmuC